MAELVDALDLGSSFFEVLVRFQLSALSLKPIKKCHGDLNVSVTFLPIPLSPYPRMFQLDDLDPICGLQQFLSKFTTKRKGCKAKFSVLVFNRLRLIKKMKFL